LEFGIGAGVIRN